MLKIVSTWMGDRQETILLASSAIKKLATCRFPPSLHGSDGVMEQMFGVSLKSSMVGGLWLALA
jgi:hypothetical protein